MPTKVITTETGNTINYKLIKDGYKTITNSISVTPDMETNTTINLDAPSTQYVSDLTYSVDVTGDYQPLIEINSFTSPDDKTIKGGYYSYMPKNEDGYIYKKQITFYPYNNFTIVGSPNLNTYTGYVNGFSVNNRLQLTNRPTYASGTISSFEFMFKVHTPETFTPNGRLLNDFNSYDDVKLEVYSTGMAFNYGASATYIYSNSLSISSNTDYWIRAIYNNGIMSLDYSTDGVNYSVASSREISSSEIKILSSTFDIGARYYGNQDPGCTWAGSIDLSQTYIKINGEYYWNPQSSETITEEISFKAEGILDDSVTTDNYTQIQTHKLFDVQENKTNEVLNLTNNEPTIDYLYRQYVQDIVIPARQHKYVYQSNINFISYGNINYNIDTGVATGFDANSYIEAKETMPSFNTFEMVFAFKLNSYPTSNTYIIGNRENVYQGGMAIYAQSSRYTYIRFSSNGSSWDNYIRSWNRVYTGTKYYFKVTYDGSTYTFYTSTDGSTYSSQGSVSSNKIVQTLPFDINGNATNYFDGEFYLNECYIKLDGKMWWQPGYDVEWVTNRAKFSYISNSGYADQMDFSESVMNIESGTAHHFLNPIVCTMPKNGGQTITKYELNGREIGVLTFDEDTGILSGFNSNNYLQLQNPFNPEENSWEITFKVKTDNNISTYQDLIGNYGASYQNSPQIAISNSNFRIMIPTNPISSEKICDVSGSYTVLPNTVYYIKLYFTGTAYCLDYSIDGETWVNDISFESSTTIGAATQGFIIGFNYWGSSASDYFYGTIDLSESYIKINDSIWWEGATLVTKNNQYAIISKGLSSNITTVGTPTISNDYIMTNPTSSNYLLLNNANIGSNDYEACVKFRLTGFNGSSDWKYTSLLMGTYFDMEVRKESSSSPITLYTNGDDSWSSSITGTSSLSLNTWYWLKVVKSNGTKTMYYSTDGSTWITEGSVSDNGTYSINQLYIGGAPDWSADSFLVGDIDLKETYIKINSVEVPIFDNSTTYTIGCFYDSSDDGYEQDYKVYYDNNYTQPILVNADIDYPSFITFGNYLDVVTVPQHSLYLYNNGIWTLFIPPVTPGTDVLVQYYAWKNGNDVFYTKNANITDMDPTNETLYVYWNKSKPAMMPIFNGYVDNGSLKLDYNNISYVLIRDSNLDETISETI